MNRVYKHDPKATIPTKANGEDCGFDIYSLRDVFLPCAKTTMVETGISVEVHPGTYAKIADRSSMGKLGIHVGGGIVDAGFIGQLNVILTNLTCVHDQHEVAPGVYDYGYMVHAGDRIAQLIFHKYENANLVEVASLWAGSRGTRGLGSSGK